MKKTLCLVLAILMLCLCACGNKDVGGLGSLTMDDTNEQQKSIGTLGQPTPQETSAPQEPAPAPTSTPTPAPTPEPTSEPAPRGMETENYSCPYFSVTKPVGWEVSYQAFTLQDGEARLCIYIYDPQDPINMIFYLKVMEPYFETLEMKNLYLSYPVDSVYDWSPVLDSVSAEGVLMQWAPSYTMMEIDGTLEKLVPFRNYHVESIIQTYDGGMSGNSVISAVLAEVSIPAAETTYGIFLENMLTPIRIPNTAVVYYRGENTMGFVASPAVFNSYCDVLLACKNSFDFSSFRSQYGVVTEQEEMPFTALGEVSIGS